MKINSQWLKDYVSFDYSTDELADRLTMVGLEVEEIIREEQKSRGIVVGKIKKVKNHPESDHLKVCAVDVGEGIISVVCGAPNVTENQIVPVAKIGSVLVDGMVIEPKSIRGVPSQGMICSERELGISDNHDGILVLEGDSYSVGQDFITESSGSGAILNINVTPNRPDCLSHIGIAREIGVISGKKFSKPLAKAKESAEPVDKWISVEIRDPDACPRYSARVVRDVTIGDSPEWLKQRLESVGIRSINNVVDVTNYVLMETGHPLHGFDYDLIQGQKIIVRKADKGEVFVTLDGVERKLTSEDLLICDGERPVALAGVMGGLNSEVSDHTTHILLESAYFDPMTIRRTANRFDLSTEASQRFEKGADPNGTIYAIDRAAQLLSEIAGGKVVQGVVDAYPSQITSWKVSLRPSRIHHVLGAEIPGKTVVSTLRGLGLEVTGDDPVDVSVPTFRPDLTREIDLIEEVVRHYGYEKIPARLNQDVAIRPASDDEQLFIEKLRDVFVGMGFLETLTNSMVSQNHIALITPEIQPVSVQNPISPENEFLRTSLIGSLLDSIRWNRNRSSNNLKLFEIGNAFNPKKGALPDEKRLLGAVLTGMVRSRPFWGEYETDVDFFHLKGLMETLQKNLHADRLVFKAASHDALKSETSLSINSGKVQIGWMGEIKTSILEQWDISSPVYVLEISTRELFETLPQSVKYCPIPKFPAVKRDLAIVVDEKVPVEALKEVVFKAGGKILISLDIFDVYRGKQIPSGKKSIAFSLTFLSPERTLKEEEIDPIVASIMKSLETSHSATLRS